MRPKVIKQFPHWVFVVRRDAEICPVPDPDWPDWYAPWLVCIVMDRETHQDIVPQSGEFALWLMRDPCRPIAVSLATASSIVSGRPQELAEQIEREYTVQLATNSVALSVDMNLEEVAPETFLFFDPGQQPTCLIVTLDWRVRRFAELPDFLAQMERLAKEKHPPGFRFHEAAKESERDLWRRAEALKLGPGHYLPLEVRSGSDVVPGALLLDQPCGNRLRGKLFLTSNRVRVAPGTKLFRVVKWQVGGNWKEAELLLGIVTEISETQEMR